MFYDGYHDDNHKIIRFSEVDLEGDIYSFMHVLPQQLQSEKKITYESTRGTEEVYLHTNSIILKSLRR